MTAPSIDFLPSVSKMNSSSARRNFFPQAFLCACAALLRAGHAYGAPQGELDTGFGKNGRMTIQLANGKFGEAIIQQPDGKLLFPGYNGGAGGGQNFAVLRLNSAGLIDSAFGTDGIATIGFAGFSSIATNLAVQPDGRIIVVGYAETGATRRDFALTRLNADGTIDSTFGDQGRVTLDLGGGSDSIVDIVALQNGQFVVVGTTTANGGQDAAFARFGSNGALDTSFGAGPIAGTTIVRVNGRTNEPFSIKRQLDGKFVACGAASDYSDLVYIGDMLAIRVDADGSVDRAFGSNGVALTDLPSSFSAANDCAAMPDGTLVLAGFSGEPGAVSPSLIRLLPNGMLDTTFGNAGISRFAVAHAGWAQAIVLLGDGNLAVTGFAIPLRNTNLPTDLFFARIDAQSGALDASFGNHGVTIVDFGLLSRPALVEGQGLIEQSDGKLIAVGHDVNSQLALARVAPAGSGSNGVAGFIATSVDVSEQQGTLDVSVRRTGGSTGSLSVEYDTVVDPAMVRGAFAPVSGTLTWLDGDLDPKSVTVPTNGAARFSIVLSNSTGGLAASEFKVEIVGHDTPEVAGGVSAGGRGGGSTGIAELLALALIWIFATQRRRRSNGL